jgi:flagellar motor switch protein FliM
MEKNLLQEDIDALFAAGTNAANNANSDGNAKAPEKYSFSRAGQISHDKMRAISTVNDLFARNLMHTLGAWLRMPLKVKLVAGEQLPFNEFLERLSTVSYICSLRLEPMGAVGLLELDLALAAPIVDVLLGGTGHAGQVRELTDIEEAILTAVVRVVVQELNLAWQPVGLEFVFEKRETEAQAARTMTPSEKTLCVSFEARMPDVQGVLNLCLPAVVLNAILRRLIAGGERPRRRSKDAQARMRELMGEVKFGALLQFPPVRLRAAELSSLEPGMVLRLPLPRYEMAELRVAGLQFGRAYPVRTGEHRGAQIEGETCESLMKLPAGDDAPATMIVN